MNQKQLKQERNIAKVKIKILETLGESDLTDEEILKLLSDVLNRHIHKTT